MHAAAGRILSSNGAPFSSSLHAPPPLCTPLCTPFSSSLHAVLLLAARPSSSLHASLHAVLLLAARRSPPRPPLCTPLLLATVLPTSFILATHAVRLLSAWTAEESHRRSQPFTDHRSPPLRSSPRPFHPPAIAVFPRRRRRPNSTSSIAIVAGLPIFVHHRRRPRRRWSSRLCSPPPPPSPSFSSPSLLVVQQKLDVKGLRMDEEVCASIKILLSLKSKDQRYRLHMHYLNHGKDSV
uniref:Uncharacterized protein LOC105055903 n=1 Tax=Elaeis guineensis var. tenera TaxID=51953 RepID=A0A6J0PQE3_ELAGV|nr:uncharacterized protein LOC105055903 [Elaeis guineensis]